MNRNLPDPHSHPELFDGVLVRRALAYGIDVAILFALTVVLKVLFGVAGIFTFGLAWLGFFLCAPLALILYYGATLGSPRRATLGMQAMDLVLTPGNQGMLNGWLSIAHPLLFWVSIWICWPISLAIVLFTPRRQMLHDLLLNVLMVRRSPLLGVVRSSGPALYSR